ncbi:Aste57867_3678 [Aphanomyces stellatus]|uniref:Aste57867_3678 protein n=1 Tax=Aphanomyces stellatus TaxID=120398 RepID=A0A485KBU3_9STRA|nr:hypothetical protein As57867_003667 [Aphanomyces stellatus]VFT80833.1 Aste57867_3678 [Aphanomyces stellatus]
MAVCAPQRSPAVHETWSNSYPWGTLLPKRQMCLAAAGLAPTTTAGDWMKNFKPEYYNLGECISGLQLFNATLPNCLVRGQAVIPTPCPANWTKASSASSLVIDAALLALVSALIFQMPF